MSEVRTFDTGATRDQDDNKHDPEGFLSPLVVRRYNAYMHKHRYQADGTVRQSDNWQKGMPLDVFMKSGWRHFLDWWTLHRGHAAVDADGQPVDIEEAICAVLFNASGALHEILAAKATKAKQPNPLDDLWFKPLAQGGLVEIPPGEVFVKTNTPAWLREQLVKQAESGRRIVNTTLVDNLDHHRPGDCPACDKDR